MFTKNYDKQINMAKDKIMWEQWHVRYGHIGITGLKYLLNDKLVDGLEVDENLPIPECKACIQAKHSRQSFPKESENRSAVPGEITHTDMWGPSQTTAITGVRYYITFIDDCTRLCTVKFMKTKKRPARRFRNIFPI